MAAYTPNSTFLARIEDYLGDVFTEYNENGLADVFDNTLREIVTMLPPDLLYSRGSYSVANGNKFVITDGTAVDVAGKIFVSAYRENGTQNILCEMVGLKDWFSAGDSNSIYSATNGSPVCNIDESNNFYILPAPDDTDKAKLYAFDASYNESSALPLTTGQVGYNADVPGQGKGLFAVIINGLPVEANEALTLKAALNCLTAYVSEAVQEDEDTEIMSLVNAQIQYLQSKLVQEMTRLGIKPDEPVEV
jgi:hypothetical protein